MARDGRGRAPQRRRPRALAPRAAAHRCGGAGVLDRRRGHAAPGGHGGDVVLLDADPLAGPHEHAREPGASGPAGGDVVPSAGVATHLRSMPVAATFVAGRSTHPL
ncbi:hypothetical protein [Georgenia sp. SUBG003]|uniref:hypothetical protein n=1 Tax=Georgenia sp. SUBG003 TaxID=1497974 RepID=UPI000ADE8E92